LKIKEKEEEELAKKNSVRVALEESKKRMVEKDRLMLEAERERMDKFELNKLEILENEQAERNIAQQKKEEEENRLRLETLAKEEKLIDEFDTQVVHSEPEVLT
jgi:hypothetical protein